MNRQLEVAIELGEKIDELFWNIPEDFTLFTDRVCELTHRIHRFSLAILPYNYQLFKNIQSFRFQVWETYYMLRKAKFKF